MLHFTYRDACISYCKRIIITTAQTWPFETAKNPAMRPEIAQFTVFREYVIYMLFLVVLLWEMTHCEGNEAMLGNILADAKGRTDI